MSERGNAQSEVYRASLKIGEAAGALEEAIDAIARYDFLAAANATELERMASDHAALKEIENRLWDMTVETGPSAPYTTSG
jgi:hypothetical protein